MVPQVADRLPQIRLRRRAEDLGGGALRLGVWRPEQDAAAPDPVLSPAYQETYGDELSVESDGGKVVNDRVDRVVCAIPCQLVRQSAYLGLNVLRNYRVTITYY